jgi:hypothetical protein
MLASTPLNTPLIQPKCVFRTSSNELALLTRANKAIERRLRSSSEVGNRYATTRVFHAGRRHRGGLVACRARAGRRGKSSKGRLVPTYEIDLERDLVASSLGVAVVSKPS